MSYRAKEELRQKMKQIVSNAGCDPELDHIKADDLLLKMLKMYGESELVKDFESFNKWYA